MLDVFSFSLLCLYICTICECDTFIIAFHVCMLILLIKFEIRVISILKVSGTHAQFCDYIVMEKKGALPVIKIEKFSHDFIWGYITWQIQFSCANWSLARYYYLFNFCWLDPPYNHQCSKFSVKTKKTCTSVQNTKHPLGN